MPSLESTGRTTPSSVCSRRGRRGPGTSDEGLAGAAVPVGGRELGPAVGAAATSPPLTLAAVAPRASSVAASMARLHRADGTPHARVSAQALVVSVASSSCREHRARVGISLRPSLVTRNWGQPRLASRDVDAVGVHRLGKLRHSRSVWRLPCSEGGGLGLFALGALLTHTIEHPPTRAPTRRLNRRLAGNASRSTYRRVGGEAAGLEGPRGGRADRDEHLLRVRRDVYRPVHAVWTGAVDA